MPTPNKDYRENPDRAVYVMGKITQQMVHDLTPKINLLRNSSAEPITVYIDSPGGNIALAEAIRCLVTSPTQDGNQCRLITVVTGTAASAAADFLALGDYSIAHRHAEIIYHGSRQSWDYELTFEWASMLAANLQAANERFALRLARCSFPRLIWRVVQFKETFAAYRNGTGEFSQLIGALEEQFLPSNRILLKEAFAKQGIIANLRSSVAKHLKRFRKLDLLSQSQFEAELLKAIITYRAQVHKTDGWLFSKTGMQEIVNDFGLLHDFYYGSQTRDLDSFVTVFGLLFLSTEQQTELRGKSGPERDKYLKDHASKKLQPLWYFVVSLCRLLQTKDYQLTPQEAYWMGVVDEVPGSGLVNDREMIENLPREEVDSTPKPAEDRGRT